MNIRKKITVLIPAYNESASIPALVDALENLSANLPDYEWEYLFVNDGSRDNTLKVLSDLRPGHPNLNYLIL